jgi:hypothetical protein
MDTCTLTRTVAETTLLPHVLEAGNGWRAAVDLQVRGDLCALLAQPSAAASQGGAIVTFGMAPVTTMVFDHTYSTRPGPSSCSPPV